MLIKLEFWRQIFEKSSNNEFHENPSSGSRAFPRGQTVDRRTDGLIGMTKLIAAFRNFSVDPDELKNKKYNGSFFCLQIFLNKKKV